MTMKSILVCVEESGQLTSILTTALLAGRRFGSYLEGLPIRPEIVGMVSGDGMGSGILVERFEREDWERVHVVAQQFRSFMDDNGVVWGEGEAAGAVSAGWHEDVPPGDGYLGSRGRVFDLTVLGRPVRGAAAPRLGPLETALFETGRPVLIAPPETPAVLGDTVAIAWNGSTETVHVVALGMPLLERAKRVVVLVVEEGMVPGPSGEALALTLSRNGIPVEVKEVQAGRRSVGETFLDESVAAGADLLFKGAYTQSRLRQMIFGGATSHILSEARIPVLMAH